MSKTNDVQGPDTEEMKCAGDVREVGRRGTVPVGAPSPAPGAAGPAGARSLTQRWGLLFQIPETPSATYQKPVDASVCVTLNV